MDKEDRRPIIDPVLLLLRSRRFLIAIVSVIMVVLTAALPELEAIEGQLFAIIVSIAGLLIGGYSLEDAANARPRTEELRTFLEEFFLEEDDE